MSRRQQEEKRRRERQLGSRNSSYTVEPPVSSFDPAPRNRISQFVMNLPDTAIEFLDAFRGSMDGAESGRDLTGVYQVMPMVHCHCFTRFLDPAEAEADIRKVRCL